jgi:hypothetical protein
MSSLLILGDTSGSVLLQAPAVAGSGTLTLPTTGGTVLSNKTPGCVLQVVANTNATPVSTSSTSTWSTTGLTGSITPSSASSKILVLVMQEIQVWSSGQPYATGLWQLLRTVSASSTVIYTPSSTSNGNVFSYDYGGSGINRYNPMPIHWLDSPNTTNAVTYTTQIKIGTNGGNVIGADSNSPSSIILMEIAG